MTADHPAPHPSMAQPAPADIKAVCVLVAPTVIVTAATNAAGAVVATHQYQQRAGAPEWEGAFLESVLAQDPLLPAAPEGVIFIVADSRQLVIPDELYAEAEVPLWFGACYQHAPAEPLLPARMPGVTYRIMGVLPQDYSRALANYSTPHKLLPLGVSLLRMPPAVGAVALLTVFGETAFGVLYAAGGLKESFVCTHTNSAEVAYALKRLCGKHQVPEENMLLRCNALTETDRAITTDLRLYFGEAASAGDDDTVLSSLMRVCACAL